MLDLSRFDGCAPGPLALREGFDPVTLADPYAVVDAAGRVVCWLPDVDTSTDESVARFGATSDLFRAAPSLLSELREAREENERLREALGRFVRLCPSSEGLGGHAPMEAFVIAADAARLVLSATEKDS